MDLGLEKKLEKVFETSSIQDVLSPLQWLIDLEKIDLILVLPRYDS